MLLSARVCISVLRRGLQDWVWITRRLRLSRQRLRIAGLQCLLRRGRRYFSRWRAAATRQRLRRVAQWAEAARFAAYAVMSRTFGAWWEHARNERAEAHRARSLLRALLRVLRRKCREQRAARLHKQRVAGIKARVAVANEKIAVQDAEDAVAVAADAAVDAAFLAQAAAEAAALAAAIREGQRGRRTALRDKTIRRDALLRAQVAAAAAARVERRRAAVMAAADLEAAWNRRIAKEEGVEAARAARHAEAPGPLQATFALKAEVLMVTDDSDLQKELVPTVPWRVQLDTGAVSGCALVHSGTGERIVLSEMSVAQAVAVCRASYVAGAVAVVTARVTAGRVAAGADAARDAAARVLQRLVRCANGRGVLLAIARETYLPRVRRATGAVYYTHSVTGAELVGLPLCARTPAQQAAWRGAGTRSNVRWQRHRSQRHSRPIPPTHRRALYSLAGSVSVAPEWAVRVSEEGLVYYGSRKNPSLRSATAPDHWIVCCTCHVELALKQCSDTVTCRRAFFCADCFITAHRSTGGAAAEAPVAAGVTAVPVAPPVIATGAAAVAAAGGGSPAAAAAVASPGGSRLSRFGSAFRFGKAVAPAAVVASTAVVASPQAADSVAAPAERLPSGPAWHLSKSWAPREAYCTACRDATAVALCAHSGCLHAARCRACEQSVHAITDHSAWRISLVRTEPARVGSAPAAAAAAAAPADAADAASAEAMVAPE